MKKTSKLSAAVLLILGILFLLYGVYMVFASINYVNTYTTTATVSVMASLQYVITSTSAYFGFGITFIAASIIINKLNALIDNSASEKKSPVVPEAVLESAATVVPAKVADPLAVSGDGLPEITDTPTEEPVAPIPETVEAPEESIEDTDENGEPNFEVEYIYEEVPPAQEAAEVNEPVIEEPVAEVVEAVIEEPVAEVVEAVIEEPVAEVVEAVIEKPAEEVAQVVIEEPVEEVIADPAPAKDEFSQIISELEEIKIEEELAGMADSLVEDIKEEAKASEQPFKITSDFIKDIFESK